MSEIDYGKLTEKKIKKFEVFVSDVFGAGCNTAKNKSKIPFILTKNQIKIYF